jgi:hypothetical protein
MPMSRDLSSSILSKSLHRVLIARTEMRAAPAEKERGAIA